MNIEEIKQEVVYSDSQSRLFEITIELTEEISKNHIELSKTEDNMKKTEIKGQISLLSTLQKIIEKRIDDVISVEQHDNRHFKFAAEIVLKKGTYNRIVELSLLRLQDLKKQRRDLKANKLE